MNTAAVRAAWEERANAWTHGVGFFLSLVGLTALLVVSIERGSAWHAACCTIYGVCAVILYASSTLYHTFWRESPARRMFRCLDHAAIFLMIAGTYTPFTLLKLGGAWGWALCGAVWAIALAGVLGKLIWIERFQWAPIPIYVIMGGLCLVAAGPILRTFPAGLTVLVATGGVLYLVGLVFFRMDRMPYNHAVWHLFVLAGSATHYYAILSLVLSEPVA